MTHLERSANPIFNGQLQQNGTFRDSPLRFRRIDWGAISPLRIGSYSRLVVDDRRIKF
jgi:hypothetical protein